jgi:hypothetical protein
MKKTALFSIVFFFATIFSIFAQEQKTLIGSVNDFGGYGGPMMQFTSIDGEFGFMMGGGGAALFNRKFILGGYGLGLTNPLNRQITIAGSTDPIPALVNMGHGGFILGYILNSEDVIHFGVSTLAGWGSVYYTSPLSNSPIYLNGRDRLRFFNFNPSLDVELNLTKFMRIQAGVGYRILAGYNPSANEGLTGSQLGGLTTSLNFKFGWFQ